MGQQGSVLREELELERGGRLAAEQLAERLNGRVGRVRGLCRLLGRSLERWSGGEPRRSNITTTPGCGQSDRRWSNGLITV